MPLTRSPTGCMSLNDTSDIIAMLKKRGAKKVALQFPEGLKRRAAGIAADLKAAGFDVIVSGDPCYGACDLALDTLPYNSHTTASDALWAGLPVLTLPGTSFTARVAASVLQAIELPELIASSVEDYVARAVVLAQDVSQLKAIREKLREKRISAPLFDTEGSTRALETVFARLVDRNI